MCSYEIEDYLGKGTFGQVVKCVEVIIGETEEEREQKKLRFAIKVLKNKRNYYYQGLVEVKVMLKVLNELCKKCDS